jgi:hypothetical protein
LKIKYFTDGVLQSESVEDGFVVMVRTENISMFKLFGDEAALVSPYEDKKFSLPNDITLWIRISRSNIFDDAREEMKTYQGLSLLEFRIENAKLEIEL